MSSCASCRDRSVPAAPSNSLLQIRQGYRARWNDLVFSIEADSSQWTLRVSDSAKKALYTGYRSGAKAAQVAALEFAIWLVLGPASRVSPEHLARELNWQQYW